MKTTTASSDAKALYTKLLQACGVNSAADLAKNNPEKLLRWMEEVNSERRIVRQLPSHQMVHNLVSSAKMMAV